MGEVGEVGGGRPLETLGFVGLRQSSECQRLIKLPVLFFFFFFFLRCERVNESAAMSGRENKLIGCMINTNLREQRILH